MISSSVFLGAARSCAHRRPLTTRYPPPAYRCTGNPRAKDALKYVVLANMLALSDINPFAAQEAIAFQEEKEVSNDVTRYNFVKFGLTWLIIL